MLISRSSYFSSLLVSCHITFWEERVSENLILDRGDFSAVPVLRRPRSFVVIVIYFDSLEFDPTPRSLSFFITFTTDPLFDLLLDRKDICDDTFFCPIFLGVPEALRSIFSSALDACISINPMLLI